jgi:glycosyltransferase involved in cell wall biosynthesis
MPRTPRITIAVPSFNQAQFIRETLQSLVDQRYPNLEVIVQDGGSTDGAIAIAQEFVAQYPDVFQLHVQKDRGHAHAVNMAFARSTGEILGYLNTDDILLPGCLDRVAREIDPSRNRFIVFGRSVFTGEAGARYVGLEHPAEYRGRFDLLAVWRRGYNAIPQPSTFWHRAVHERYGGFDEGYNQGLDFLQWCRFSKTFWFHKVDELWSTYRMHPASVSSNKTEEDWLEIMIEYSRMHWGPWWTPLRWRCELSHWFYRWNRRHDAQRHARQVDEARAVGRSGPAFVSMLKTAKQSPHVAYHRFAVPAMRRLGVAGLDRRVISRVGGGFTGRYADGWIGPVYRTTIEVPPDATRLRLQFEHYPQAAGRHAALEVTLIVDGRRLASRRVVGREDFSLEADVTPWRGRSCRYEVESAEYFIPRVLTGVPDGRRLSVILRDQCVE